MTNYEIKKEIEKDIQNAIGSFKNIVCVDKIFWKKDFITISICIELDSRKEAKLFLKYDTEEYKYFNIFTTNNEVHIRIEFNINKYDEILYLIAILIDNFCKGLKSLKD